MADDKNNEKSFSNEDTLVRRAWIDSALEGVRAQIDAPLPAAETAAYVVEGAGMHPEQSEAEEERPGLYLAWSADERRSGT
jgi:hypothetical protein